MDLAATITERADCDEDKPRFEAKLRKQPLATPNYWRAR